jgi:hypothetical protein
MKPGPPQTPVAKAKTESRSGYLVVSPSGAPARKRRMAHPPVTRGAYVDMIADIRIKAKHDSIRVRHGLDRHP